MKKFNKLMLTVLAVFALALVIKMPAQAADAKIRQTGCTGNSISLSWTKADSTRSFYNSTYGKYYSYSLDSYMLYNTSDPDIYYTKGFKASKDATSYVIRGLSNNVDDKIYLFPVYRYGSDYKISTYWDSYTLVNTLPSTPARNNFVVSSGSTYSGRVYFDVKKPTSCGYQLQLFKGRTLVGTYNNMYCATVAKNTVYQYRIRYTFKNYSNGVTYCSNWSPVRKFALGTLKGSSRSNKKGFKVTMPKASGISNYSVYVSKTSSKSGYVKVKTIKPKKKNVRITKKYKKRATNYIKLTPNIPGYGPSDLSSYYYLYVYK